MTAWDYVPDFMFKAWWDINCMFGHHYDILDDGRCSWCRRLDP